MSSTILVADKLDPSALSALGDLGAKVENLPKLTADELSEHIGPARVLIVRSTRVSAKTIEAGANLGLIVRAGSGVNTIDVDAASNHGICVANCPGRNSIAVAELAMGLILAIDRRLADNVSQLREGRWNKAGFAKARGIKGQRLGLVGFGAIAQAVAARALAFEMSVFAYSRSLTESQAQEAGVTRVENLKTLFSECDVVSLHVPQTPQTKSMVDAELLASMKDGAVLINTSRAGVVDNDALQNEAQSGRIFVGTDVFAQEPEQSQGEFQDPLGALPNVYGSHHIGASTGQAQLAIAQAAVELVKEYLHSGAVRTAVNVHASPPAHGTLIVRHLDRVGVLASVLQTLRAAQINVQNMENVIFVGGKAACARIRVAVRPEEALLKQLQQLEHVLGVDLTD